MIPPPNNVSIQKYVYIMYHAKFEIYVKHTAWKDGLICAAT